MLNDKARAEAEQAMAYLTETLPPMLWSFYRNCVNEGFSGDQATSLTVICLKETLRGGKKETSDG